MVLRRRSPLCSVFPLSFSNKRRSVVFSNHILFHLCSFIFELLSRVPPTIPQRGHNALTGLVRVGVLCFVNIYNGVDITQSYPVFFFFVHRRLWIFSVRLLCIPSALWGNVYSYWHPDIRQNTAGQNVVWAWSHGFCRPCFWRRVR